MRVCGRVKAMPPFPVKCPDKRNRDAEGARGDAKSAKRQCYRWFGGANLRRVRIKGQRDEATQVRSFPVVWG